MCSNFCQAMDNYQGDLADIVRARGSAISDNITMTATTDDEQTPNWQFGLSETSSNINIEQSSYEQFKDLYTYSDPLLRDIDAISSPGPFVDMGPEDANIAVAGGVFSTPAANSNKLCNIFPSKMIQISPNATSICSISSNSSSNSNAKLPILAASPKIMKTSFGFMSNAMMNNSSKDGFIGGATGLQIPSPRNSGIKRRKSPAKKVVVIPAPAAANSRQTGEVVPSDLWAWRKYGQKPIKGSPYPRGYYRCSSSKGCSARKQVERSRTDPKMLVITYTSEHNHPWPTQRNALAGSSRGHPATKDEVLVKEEINHELQQDNDDVRTPTTMTSLANHTNASGNVTTAPKSMKEEEVTVNEVAGNTAEEEINQGHRSHHEFNDNYRPILMPETNSHHQADQDFFKGLVEFEGDDEPLNLLFTQETKGSDPFSFFDWTQNAAATTTTNAANGESNDRNDASPREVKGGS